MSKVQLYVYDLSQGMAKSMSLMLTGKQIDGIWHTSVVAFGREVFYGQGILESKPGQSHHGAPHQIIEVGETHIDEATFNEYIQSLGEMYTPTKYHLIEFNCNHFTADVVGFLTGGEIPAWISGLPSEFLSTPFGQALKPQIDAMFRRTAPSEHAVTGQQPATGATSLPSPPPSGAATPNAGLAASLLQSVAAAAASRQGGPGQTTTGAAGVPTPPNPETSPLALVSSTANFHSILTQHSAVVVNFTNTPSCPPCRVIKPVYESIAALHAPTYGAKGARFVEVELGVGQGREIAGQYGVQATPTFMFFKDGKKAGEMKGADKRGLESRVETFLEECYPTHPHRKMFLPAVERLSRTMITATSTPNYGALVGKVEGLVAGKGKETEIKVLKDEVVPVLQGTKTFASIPEQRQFLERFIQASDSIISVLQPTDCFPIIDLWRVALLQPSLPSLLALRISTNTPASPPSPLTTIFTLSSSAFSSASGSVPKPFILTLCYFIFNLLSSSDLANLVLTHDAHSPLREKLVQAVTEGLLHPDVKVRQCAAGAAFNVGVWRQVSRGNGEETPQVDWEVEMVSGLVEAIERETDEETLHRLLAALGHIIYLSPGYEEDVKPMLQVLEAKSKIQKKKYAKEPVKKLANEIAEKLC
ncbi:hypothetical protein IAT38_002447 [Cryptococcus sp. DSM 104549]